MPLVARPATSTCRAQSAENGSATFVLGSATFALCSRTASGAVPSSSTKQVRPHCAPLRHSLWCSRGLALVSGCLSVRRNFLAPPSQVGDLSPRIFKKKGVEKQPFLVLSQLSRAPQLVGRTGPPPPSS